MNGGISLDILATPMRPAGLAALIFALFLYANLSRRLGAVTKMSAHYRWFFVGAAFIALALVVSIIRGAASLSCGDVPFLTTPAFGLFFYHCPLLIGTIINVIVTWKYWSWLLVRE